MSLLATLLYSVPETIPPNVRRVVAEEMRDPEPKVKPLLRKGCGEGNYGTVQPRILEYLKTTDAAEPNEIARILDVSRDRVRKSIKRLHEKKLIVCLRKANQGLHMSALWGIKGEAG